jgi:hypothetical protein
MNPEQEPDLTDKNDIDPSIDPKVLVEQEGPNAGTIAPVETGTGIMQMYDKQEDGTKTPNGEMQVRTIEGLPVVGAYAERENRDNSHNYNFSAEDMRTLAERAKDPSDHLFGKVTDETTPEEMTEILHDDKGTEAMATEVASRAVELAKKQFPFASQELIDQFGQKAAEKFKAELESKNAEKKAEHNKGVQDLIDSLDSPDTALSAVVPEDESEATSAVHAA